MKLTKSASLVVFADGEVGLQIIRIMLKHDPRSYVASSSRHAMEAVVNWRKNIQFHRLNSIRPAHMKLLSKKPQLLANGSFHRRRDLEGWQLGTGPEML
jgi:hypothetical protein